MNSTWPSRLNLWAPVIGESGSRRHRRRALESTLCIAALYALSASSGRLLAEEKSELSVDAVISAISDFEKRVDAFKFHCEVWNGSFIESEGWEMKSRATLMDRSPLAVGVIHAAADVLFSVSQSKYRAKLTLLFKTSMDGRTPEEKVRYSSLNEDFSNDGTQLRRQRTGAFTRVRPQPKEPIKNWKNPQRMKAGGIISVTADEVLHEENKGFMRLRAYNLGLAHVTPFVAPELEPPQRLSQLLKAKKDGGDYIVARTTPAGLWEIHYMVKTSVQPSYAFRVLYDPKRGRINHCELGGCRECKEYGWADWHVNRVTDYQYADDKTVLPERVFVIDVHGSGEMIDGKPVKDGMQWIYTNCELNPPTTNDEFRLQFDEGTEVIDHVDKKIYVVGSGLENDQQSIDKFLLYHGIIEPGSGNGKPAPPKSLWIMVVLNGVILGLVSAVVIRRRIAGTLL